LPAQAFALQPGVALRWDACLGDGGTQNRAFACDTNTGSETLVASYVPGRDFNGVTGLEPQIDIFSSSAGIPGWWQFKNVGTCRQTSLSISFAPPAGAIACIDAAPGLLSGGIGTYEFLSGQRIRVRMAFAVAPPDTFSLFNGQHYFAFSLKINHAKTVGAGSCAGCSAPMCIGYSGVTITSLDQDPEGTAGCTGGPACGSRHLLGPADGAAGDRVTWQGGVMAAFSTSPGFFPEGSQLFDVREATCAAATAARPSTWGAVKSLYR